MTIQKIEGPDGLVLVLNPIGVTANVQIIKDNKMITNTDYQSARALGRVGGWLLSDEQILWLVDQGDLVDNFILKYS